MTIAIKRAYEAPAPGDGYRVLVDRIWPRGVSKDQAALDAWLKDLAPSTGLRKWYGHDPALWPEFCRRYDAELAASDAAQTALAELRQRARKGRVTLVHAARDSGHSNAAWLQQLLSG